MVHIGHFSLLSPTYIPPIFVPLRWLHWSISYYDMSFLGGNELKTICLI